MVLMFSALALGLFQRNGIVLPCSPAWKEHGEGLDPVVVAQIDVIQEMGLARVKRLCLM